MIKLTLLLLSLLFISSIYCGTAGIYEIPVSGFPQYGVPSGNHIFADATERAMEVWMNMARVAPYRYRDDYLTLFMGDGSYYNVFNTSTYNSVLPVYWNLNLNRAARAHSFDIATNCPTTLQHTDCNGTSTSARVALFATSNTSSSYSGEDFVNAYQLSPNNFSCNSFRFWPGLSMAGFICDKFYSTNCRTTQCATDGFSTAGHRDIIMNGNNKQVGIGNVWTGSYGTTTHDFSSSTTPYSPNNTPLIVTGSNVWYNISDPNAYRYFVVINAIGRTINSVQLYVNNVPETLTYYAGINATVGVYQSTKKTYTNNCDSYYFTLTYNTNQVYVYPQSGQFKIWDGASCTVSWVSSGGATSSPSTPSPTTPSPTPGTPSPSTPSPTTPSPSTPSPTTQAPTSAPNKISGTYTISSSCAPNCCCLNTNSLSISQSGSSLSISITNTTGTCSVSGAQSITFVMTSSTTGTGTWNGTPYNFNKISDGKYMLISSTNSNCNATLTCDSGNCKSSAAYIAISFLLMFFLLFLQF